MFKFKMIFIMCFCVFFCSSLSAEDPLFRMTDSQFDSFLSRNVPVYIKLSDKQFRKFVSAQTENPKSKQQSSSSKRKSESFIWDGINFKAIAANVPYILISILVNKTILRNVQNPITSSIASFAITSVINGIVNGMIKKYKFIMEPIHDFVSGTIKRTNLIFGSRLRAKPIK